MRTLLFKIDDKFGISTLCHYTIVGALSAGINVLIFALLYDVLHVYYKIAFTVSYIAAILFNFTSNRHFTFKSSGENLQYHLFRYLTMIALNYCITYLLVHGSVKYLALSPYIGLFASIAVTAIIGFLLSKFWIFT